MAKTTDFHAFVPGLGNWRPPPACHPSLNFRQVQISSTRIVPVSVKKTQALLSPQERMVLDSGELSISQYFRDAVGQDAPG